MEEDGSSRKLYMDRTSDMLLMRQGFLVRAESYTKSTAQNTEGQHHSPNVF